MECLHVSRSYENEFGSFAIAGATVYKLSLSRALHLHKRRHKHILYIVTSFVDCLRAFYFSCKDLDFLIETADRTLRGDC